MADSNNTGCYNCTRDRLTNNPQQVSSMYIMLLGTSSKIKISIGLIFSQVIIAKQACSQDLQEEGVTKMPGYVDM